MIIALTHMKQMPETCGECSNQMFVCVPAGIIIGIPWPEGYKRPTWCPLFEFKDEDERGTED